jgi:predicted lipid-binding transport protein (Tim44 family)
MMKGRPFLGVISGFFFGLFGAVTLFLFGVIPLDSHLVWILPILGIVLGLLMATWAPFGSSKVDQPAPAATPASAPPAATPESTDDTVVDENPPVEPPADGSASAEEPPVH